MRDVKPENRNAITMSPQVLDHFESTRASWYESPEQIHAGIKWGYRKAGLLRWVRCHMAARLSLRERQCIDLYYFQGMTFEEVGLATGTNASTCWRAVQRGVRKLREAAQEHPPRRFLRD